ncbi:MAG: hypothetical protein IT323_15400 [Anaerolineae bacterium]|nr:hypothetical protein [Anaerolineae bacterium]
MGKSALAQYIAATKQAHLWDLSRLVLGTNTFQGTLASSFQLEALPGLIEDLRKGQVLFVLDAFDEAEIVSGWPRVEEFLREVFGFVKNASGPCIVLLARGETAFYMDMHLDTLAAENNLPRRHTTLSIEYFEEYQAKDFIAKQLEKLGKSAPKQHTDVLRRAVEKVFSLFIEAVRADEPDEPGRHWAQQKVRSFLGYAPVLQAIATYFSEVGNLVEVENLLNRDRTSASAYGAKLICFLMNNLLEREHNKVVKQLQQAGIPEAQGWNGWDKVFTPSEQLQRLFLYVQPEMRQKAFAVDTGAEEIPNWLARHYIDLLNRFLVQHPFIFDDVFTGPAFEDYTFARLLVEVRLYEQVKAAWDKRTSGQKTYVSSPLFSHLYWKLSSGVVSGDLAGYVYESAISRRSFKSEPRLVIVPLGEGDNSVHRFRVFDEDSRDDQEPGRGFKLIVDEDHPLVFKRQLARAYIEVQGRVILGIPGGNFELSNTELVCTTLEIQAATVVVRNYQEEERVSLEADHFAHDVARSVVVDCNESSRLSISWPDGKTHPWAEYYRQPVTYTSVDTREAVLAIRRVLTFFRRDRNAEFARYKLLIDNVVVGANPMRQAMRDFMVAHGIITHKEPLYYLDLSSLEVAGINWTSLRQGKVEPRLESFVEKFFAWSRGRAN